MEGFVFCKTAQKPYDFFVVGVLLIVHYVAPDILDIGSDGDLEDWQPIIDYLENGFDLKFNFPVE